MYVFSAEVEIPPKVIEKIGMDIKETVMDHLVGYVTTEELKIIGDILNGAIDFHSYGGLKSTEGWELEASEVRAIAKEIENGRKIGAIKEFRAATGAGLKDAKFFIDKFDMNETGAKLFIGAFRNSS